MRIKWASPKLLGRKLSRWRAHVFENTKCVRVCVCACVCVTALSQLAEFKRKRTQKRNQGQRAEEANELNSSTMLLRPHPFYSLPLFLLLRHPPYHHINFSFLTHFLPGVRTQRAPHFVCTDEVVAPDAVRQKTTPRLSSWFMLPFHAGLQTQWRGGEGGGGR